jgi:hypothetical protein
MHHTFSIPFIRTIPFDFTPSTYLPSPLISDIHQVTPIVDLTKRLELYLRTPLSLFQNVR